MRCGNKYTFKVYLCRPYSGMILSVDLLDKVVFYGKENNQA